MTRDALVEVAAGSEASMSGLFRGLIPAQLHVDAVLQGDAVGTFYANSLRRPRVGCLLAGEGCYLGGRADDAGFFDAVNELLPRDRCVAIFAGSDVGAEGVSRVTHGLYAIPAKRRAAVLRRTPTHEFPLPAGVTLRAVDGALLAGDAPGTDEVREAVLDEWKSLDRYIERGFGTAAAFEGRVVAHSISDYVVGSMCEIGVHVASSHRRQGIGTAVAAGTAREAYARGLKTVTWHSWANNVGSIAISRHLGFADEVFYTVLFNHWAAENIADMSQDEFRAFGEEYERRFAQCPPGESGYPYVVAATAWAMARDRGRCLANLHRAVDVGWLTSIRQLKDLWPELFFDPSLPERAPEWAEFFARLRPGERTCIGRGSP